MTEYHKVVTLILLRMESHPEEFIKVVWANTIQKINQWGTEEEKAAIKAGQGKVMLDREYELMCKKLYGAEDENDTEIEATSDAELLRSISQGRGGIIPVNIAQSQMASAAQQLGQLQSNMNPYDYQNMMQAQSPLATNALAIQELEMKLAEIEQRNHAEQVKMRIAEAVSAVKKRWGM